MKRILFCTILCAFLISCNNESKEEVKPEASSATAKTEVKGSVELLSASYNDQFDKAFTAFEKHDATGWTGIYADDAKFYFSSGDSLIGRKAIQEYYEGRLKLIESISFPEKIYLPISSSEMLSASTPGGKWMLAWSLTNVKYKNGKSLSFWVHNAYHLNDAGKVDHCAQFIDRLPLKAATE